MGAPVSERVRAGLRLVETLTKHPRDLDEAMLAQLRGAGLDDEAIEDAANVAFHFNFINRLADAFDFPLLDEEQQIKLARVLNRAGKIVGASRPDPSHARGADGQLRPVEVERGRAHALSCEGVTEPALRRAVEAHAASFFGARRGDHDDVQDLVPGPLRGYVEKLARWAYKIIDEDIEALKQAGYEEEAIYELTFVGAMGASVPALERLFGLLYGALTVEGCGATG